MTCGKNTEKQRMLGAPKSDVQKDEGGPFPGACQSSRLRGFTGMCGPWWAGWLGLWRYIRLQQVFLLSVETLTAGATAANRGLVSNFTETVRPDRREDLLNTTQVCSFFSLPHFASPYLLPRASGRQTTADQTAWADCMRVLVSYMTDKLDFSLS